MLNKILQPEILVFLIPIVALIGGFVIAAIKMNYAHEERIAKINAGIDPDAEYDEEEQLELYENYQSKEVKRQFR